MRSTLIALILAATAASAQAAVLDFDVFGAANGETIIVGDEFQGEFGVTFSAPQPIAIVEVGNPPGGQTIGFVPDDTPIPGDALGTFFLSTGRNGPAADLIIDFDVPTTALSFDIADIDGDVGSLNFETFTVEARDASDFVLSSLILDSNTPGAGNATVVSLGFSNIGDISRIVINGVHSNQDELLGIAFDNFNVSEDVSTTVVPVPAALPLMLGALAMIGWVSRRRAQAA